MADRAPALIETKVHLTHSQAGCSSPEPPPQWMGEKLFELAPLTEIERMANLRSARRERAWQVVLMNARQARQLFKIRARRRNRV
jgi:hypothetical protein